MAIFTCINCGSQLRMRVEAESALNYVCVRCRLNGDAPEEPERLDAVVSEQMTRLRQRLSRLLDGPMRAA